MRRRSLSKLWYLTFPLALLWVVGCNKQQLDKDGGYIDQRTNRYIYVRPSHLPPSGYKNANRRLRPNEPQMISAKVGRIDKDLKSVWLAFEDRQSYQMLASDLTAENRDDREKRLRVQLKFVSPLASVAEKKFKQTWADYTTQVLETQLLNRQVFAEAHYQKESKQIFGYLFQKALDKDGKETDRNLNRWMIEQGLSYFYFEDATPEEIKDYSAAQALAKEHGAGLWKYQQ
ncbi:MAG: hypothetical protein A2600_03650 [Candidatus Lambdaproteobacteria bacterium RIFOXYD1_FULL_56_27]|uniref:TNase-like domain-containing protein n=1 Tax=Candidatus Lambdaproteobacteria bacterium RIFOXYD2_FULL_56_26 TaxID=1817773 RepID=A0A1F6H3I2_9PROT|nr:MAG: hypothetical protein A2426_11710 [Candidatus Lambdaproteobacteria bacterium RIFOXYC1_FULL_56_13]OGH04860.1 MAG: hypothetical protein A2557_07715 [Candidatus Lambdaproteobacteria bacterium RIFOXYD2_FULL_56_26]OGH09325.1 MAG: hypothetical protein A2600_03650 [Candidatus Lambdaproteobacteria bacterium RIFOXYD1_FULL_56_27]